MTMIIRGLVACLCLFLIGCESTAYYLQAVNGHLDVMGRRVDSGEIIADPSQPEKLRERLALIGRMRDYSVADLALPDNGSYRSYSDLERKAAVWSVFAAPPLDLTLKTWCYPVIGCAAYRGYYAEADAQALGDELKAEGMDVFVGAVPAYSTLGWFDDPVLNTFVNWPEPWLAGLIFHEMAHQVVYVAGDSAFNESYAKTVEYEGMYRWLLQEGREEALCDWVRRERRREGLIKLTNALQADLKTLYASELSDVEKLARKQVLFERLREQYLALMLKIGVAPDKAQKAAESMNNARLGSIAIYNQHVPAFRALLRDLNGDFVRFHQQVEVLAELEAEARAARLQTLATAGADLPDLTELAECRVSARAD